MKPDASQYKEITDETQWVRRDRELVVLARAHGVSNVLSASYTPKSDPEYQNWYNQCSFMFMVFQLKIKFPAGKTIVQKHHRTGDAQAVYQEIKAICTTSTKARVHLNNLNKEIQTAKISPAYGKPYSEFILEFCKKVDDYNESQPNNSALITPDAARIILEGAVSNIPALEAVRTLDLHLVTTGCKPPSDFHAYIELLQSAAAIADEKRVSVGRHAHMTEGFVQCAELEEHSQYEAYRVQKEFLGGKGRLDDETWKQMPMEARKQWTEIPLETRTLIMEGKAKSNQIRKVNLMGIDATNINDSGRR